MRSALDKLNRLLLFIPTTTVAICSMAKTYIVASEVTLACALEFSVRTSTVTFQARGIITSVKKLFLGQHCVHKSRRAAFHEWVIFSLVETH